MHGATYASRLYDVPHPGASWLKATTMAGYAAYALDIRGYGKSGVPGLVDKAKPYARATDAIKDIADAVNWLCVRHNRDKIGLVGGSWGSITAAMFSSGALKSKIAALVLYAPIFGATNQGWLSFLSDPSDPNQFNPAFKGARPVCETSTRARWDAEIPPGKNWRNESVFQALVQSSLGDDPQAALRDPPAFLAPNGTLLDLWEAFNGRPLFDPSRITCPTLLIRGGADTTSTRSDALALFDVLAAPVKRYVELANGAHFASAERLGPQVFRTANAFLEDQFWM
ncbi:alpha/beta fold hydrolase [Sulfitobacter sp. TSTF-M16]|uniref:Alpha/beta fold hydrolase n=1 Tax=Sulfitobacter aestuariivivens TaxID=2766981 RepID=A0A927D6S8_9RHOB|nr:alpha/beta fold hydrolase [Sulfitobacter aestuariivivens]